MPVGWKRRELKIAFAQALSPAYYLMGRRVVAFHVDATLLVLCKLVRMRFACCPPRGSLVEARRVGPRHCGRI